MKRRLVVGWLICVLPIAVAGAIEPVATTAVVYHGAGVVNRVEPGLGIINISHGPVAVAGWQTMTRDLHVRPKELTRGLTPGMAIRFQLKAVDPLTYVITALQPIPQ